MGRALLLVWIVAACGYSTRQLPGDGGGDDTADAPIDTSAGAAALSATPAALTLAALVGTTAQSSVVFANTGDATSGALSLVLGGAAPAPFAIGMTTCTGTLTAGASCTARIDYTAPSPAASTATLTLSDGAATAVVNLTGNGSNTAGLVATPTLRDFGNVGLGSTSSSFSFSVLNTGTASTTGLAVTFDSGAAGDYMLANNLCAGAVVAPGAACTFSAQFTPTALGTRTATLKIRDAVSGAQVGVALTGVGVAVSGIIFSPAQYDFGTVTVGDSAFAHQFTISNTGSVTTGAIATAKSGANAGDFLVMADNCTTLTLAAGASCTLFVAFEPGAAGGRMAVITAVATPGGTTNTLVTGTGQ